MGRNNTNIFYSEMSEGDKVKDGVDKLAIHDDDEIDSNYKPPPEKTIEELLNADKEDESLQKYKEKLLGVANSEKIIYGSYYLLLILQPIKFIDHLLQINLIFIKVFFYQIQ